MSQRPLRWKVPAAKRAKLIPSENWERYRIELCQLYREVTLETLMRRMNTKYPGFQPKYVSL